MTALPPALRQRCWGPGESGNPSGKGGVYHEMQRLAREFSPEAVAYLIEIARDGTEDTRNRIVAMSMLLERAWGRSQPFDPAKDGEEPLRHLKLQASLEADKLPQPSWKPLRRSPKLALTRRWPARWAVPTATIRFRGCPNNGWFLPGL
jgi:hypothetical protein